ncbi:MAG: 3-oxo-5-alpha-steroid 4-dehydrogenase [Lewinellaceae bacterium]|nr:3-oxo-5-alpha-steroid 4-dehydrogenase [Lewinellaceae bacterium]
MNEFYFNSLAWAWILFALLLVPFQILIPAPYGRHTRANWGLQVDNRLGWMLMEVISPIVFTFFFLQGSAEKTSGSWVLFALWTLHYVHRSLIFPWRTNTKGKKIPLLIVTSAVFFNMANGFLNGYYLGEMQAPTLFIDHPRFIVGGLVFLLGAALNFRADTHLLRLRKPGDTGYKIPYHPVFRRVSCPNHLGEIIEWTGFAIMAWNIAAVSFAVWTAANLIPRALNHHRWYKRQFEDYPEERRAVIPYIL